jgi:radical SAM superfamily enzyme YgiQ (UPF0313 family)
MKVLLVEPRISPHMVGYTQLVRPEPLALEYVGAALLLKGHDVLLLDMRVDSRSLEEEMASFGPDIIGMTGYTTDVPEMLRLLKRVKELDPHIHTVIGGFHASLCPEDFDFDFVDFIVVGEGEETIQDLVSTLERGGDLASVPGIIYREEGRQVHTPSRKRHKLLDCLPMPARHLSDRYRGNYHFHFWENPYLVETQRGCPHRCNFCSVWVFHQMGVYYRSPEFVVNELKSLDGKTEMICFVDDEFFQNPRRAERIADLIKAEGLRFKYWAQVRADDVVRWPRLCEKWREVGMEALFIGLEKISDADLADVNKRTTVETNEKAIKLLQEDLGMDIWGSFIVDPSWTKSEFDSLIQYVKSRRIAFPSFTVLTPLPGTRLFKEKLNEIVNRNYELFDLLHTVLPTRLPLEEFYANMARLYASTTMGGKELLRRVKSGRIPASALRRIGDLLRDVTNPQAYLRSPQQAR